MKKIILIIIVCSVAISSCLSPKSSTLTKRYKTIDTSELNENVPNPDKYVVVKANCYDIETNPSSKDFNIISDRGQMALIEGAYKFTKEPTEIFSLLSNKIATKVNNEQLLDKTIIKKRIALSVENEGYKENGDRISKLIINVTIPDSLKDKVKFLYWDKLATEYKEIDIGKVTFTNKNTASVSPELSLTGTVQGKLPASFANERSLSEEVNLRARVVNLSGSLDETKATILQEGVPIQPIGGNIIFEVTMEVESSATSPMYKFENLYDKAGKPNKPSDVVMKTVTVKHPALKAPVKAGLDYTFFYRNILEGGQTFTESDDEIKILKGQDSDNSAFELISDEDISLKQWMIQTNDNKAISVKFKADDNPNTLFFGSYSEADKFLSWLKETKSLSVGKGDLHIDLTPVKLEDVDKLKVGFNRRIGS